MRSGEIVLDLDCWEALKFPSSLLTSVLVCRNGVKRAHLVRAGMHREPRIMQASIEL